MPPKQQFKIALVRYIGNIRSNITITVWAVDEIMAVKIAEREMPGWGFTKNRGRRNR